MDDLITHVIRGRDASRLLLLVHGYGADERDLDALLPYLDPNGRFAVVLPRGPFAAPGAPGFAWYSWDPSGEYDADAFTRSLSALDDLLDAQCVETGFDRSEAVVAGFSQGAGLMVTLATRPTSRPRPCGVLAMSPALPALEVLGLDHPVDAAQSPFPPILLQHGSQDPLVAVARARTLARTLEAQGVPIVYEEYEMGHQVALESLDQAHRWTERVLAGERPSEPVPADPPPGPVKAVDTATFAAEVLGSDLPVIVDFWAPWCGPCRQVSPIVEQIALMRQGSHKVVKVNIDEEPTLAQRYQVQSIPFIALFRNGRLERGALGAKPRAQLEAELGMLVIP